MPIPEFSPPPEDFYRRRDHPRNRERDEEAMRRMQDLNDLYYCGRDRLGGTYGLGSWGYTGTALDSTRPIRSCSNMSASPPYNLLGRVRRAVADGYGQPRPLGDAVLCPHQPLV